MSVFGFEGGLCDLSGGSVVMIELLTEPVACALLKRVVIVDKLVEEQVEWTD